MVLPKSLTVQSAYLRKECEKIKINMSLHKQNDSITYPPEADDSMVVDITYEDYKAIVKTFSYRSVFFVTGQCVDGHTTSDTARQTMQAQFPTHGILPFGVSSV